jgi:hypothetical protein
LSHVSPDTMKAALSASAAPVIFSHSSARALVDHPRDVPDDILALVAKNDGVVMVNFAPIYVSAARNQWEADRAAEQARYNTPPYGGLYIGQPDRAAAALKQWESAHPRPVTTLEQVADHVEHIRKVAGIDHVGLGSDFDGIPDAPRGLEGVDRYPALLVELMRRGWSDTDVAKLAGENVLRVMAAAERVSVKLRAENRGFRSHGRAGWRCGPLTQRGLKIRSSSTANKTMTNPASNPGPTCTELSARTTGTPSPPAPTSAATTTMERLSMMHWVIPARISGAALGNSTFQRSWNRVAPKACATSLSAAGTPEMPACVSRIGAGIAKITVEISPGTGPRPNSTSVGIRYTNVGSVCIRSRTGRSVA